MFYQNQILDLVLRRFKTVKILALGGAGDMGRFAVAVLLDSPVVSSITVADKNYDLAKVFVELTDSDKLIAQEVDITEHDNKRHMYTPA